MRADRLGVEPCQAGPIFVERLRRVGARLDRFDQRDQPPIIARGARIPNRTVGVGAAAVLRSVAPDVERGRPAGERGYELWLLTIELGQQKLAQHVVEATRNL